MEEKTYRQQLREAIQLSKKSGQRIRKVFDRKQFLREFPKSSSDVRMAFVPERFVLDLTPMEGITVGELRNLCLAKKDHPLAIQKAFSVEGKNDSEVVYVLREDLDVLRQGRTKKQIEVPEIITEPDTPETEAPPEPELE